MNKFLVSLGLCLILTSCSNTPDKETGEIKTLNLLKQAFDKTRYSKKFIDARNLLSREQVDAAKAPVLFVELASGQNGTLTPYPGKGVGQTWLGADGATITMERGVLKASRGMGDDLMGSYSSKPKWSKVTQNTQPYKRELSHLKGNNKISTTLFECKLNKNNSKELIEIWDVKFLVTKFEETCSSDSLKIKNTYYIEQRGIVRKSEQYHGKTIGYIVTERLDR